MVATGIMDTSRASVYFKPVGTLDISSKDAVNLSNKVHSALGLAKGKKVDEAQEKEVWFPLPCFDYKGFFVAERALRLHSVALLGEFWGPETNLSKLHSKLRKRWPALICF